MRKRDTLSQAFFELKIDFRDRFVLSFAIYTFDPTFL